MAVTASARDVPTRVTHPAVNAWSHRAAPTAPARWERRSVQSRHARARGRRSAVPYTISFQAPDFYRKQGWQLLGEVPCDPPGTSRVFLTKDLAAPGGSGAGPAPRSA